MLSLLSINNLSVNVVDKPILQGLSLNINHGEIHAIMGPNGTGKSTLASVIAGKPGYEITSGTISYKEKNLLEMPPDVRAKEGIFMSFQNPLEIPGLTNSTLIK